MNWQTELNETWVAIVTVALTLLALIFVIRAIVKNRHSSTYREPSESDALRCPCGEYAAEAAPYLRWTRGASDWLRSIYGAPPRFKRLVDPMRMATLCSHHARVADALLDAWIFNVRSRQADFNRQLAQEAAAFETEGLMAQIREGLTEGQKRSQRRPILARLSDRASGES